MNQPFGYGAIRRPSDARDLHLGTVQAPVEIPDVYRPDLSAIPVEMQGTLPTCGAHAGAFLDSVLQTKKMGAVQNLSPEVLWKLIKQIDGFPAADGTDMRSILKVLQATGTCLDEMLPDDDTLTLDAYTDPSVITDAMKANAALYKIGPQYAFEDRPTLSQIKQAIYQNQVVIALVDIGDGWYTNAASQSSWAAADVLPVRVGNPEGHHFIVLEGYDEQFCYFRNSWSDAWGNNGNGYFDASYVPHVIEIGTAVVASTPNPIPNLEEQMTLLQRVKELLQEALGHVQDAQATA